MQQSQRPYLRFQVLKDGSKRIVFIKNHEFEELRWWSEMLSEYCENIQGRFTFSEEDSRGVTYGVATQLTRMGIKSFITLVRKHVRLVESIRTEIESQRDGNAYFGHK